MTSNGYGPDAPCRRTACATRPPHLGGVHLNQRHELYDGPSSLLQVLPLAVRDSARKLVKEAPDLMPEVVDMAKHIEFLREQVAHVQVNGDRREREAMARSGDCEHHGQEIKELGEQLHAASDSDRKNNAARLAVLGLLHQIEDFIRGYDEGRIKPDVPAVVSALRKAAKATSAAHDRVWRVKEVPVRKKPAVVELDLFELAGQGDS